MPIIVIVLFCALFPTFVCTIMLIQDLVRSHKVEKQIKEIDKRQKERERNAGK